nr:unnamed protein product [Callosobruchus chinensis]
MNARNASGNTPLHVCAVNGQDSCARQLLFRGADRLALNYANQTPCQVAVIAGNMELAELIQNYRQEDVVPFRGPPAYNPRRRSAAFACSGATSVTCWTARSPSLCGLSSAAGSPRPLPANNGSGSTSSASSSLSGRDQQSSIQSGGGGVHLSLYEPDTASIVTDKSLGDTSDIISDSSGVGTANSDTTTCSATGGGGSHVGGGAGGTHGAMGVLMPAGSTVVCVQPFQAEEEGQLTIREGDIIEVTGATDDGFLEGTVRGSSGGRTASGLFPAGAVQEVRMRHSQHVQAAVARGQQVVPTGGQPTARVAGRRESAAGIGQGTAGKQFATAPRTAKGKGHWNLPAEPRTVVLHKGKKGFGFILRGAKATSPLLDLTPSEKCPALQYLDDVDPGGVADMAGLRKGDFLLEINNEDVSTSSHERVVELIRSSGDLVQMTVITCLPGLPTSRSALPVGQGAGPAPTAMVGRQYAATLPRKAMGGAGGAAGGGGGTPRAQHAPLPPRRDPKTTLSVGRARAKSMVAGLGTEVDPEDPKDSSVESMQQLNSTHSTPVPPRTASIRQRPASARIASAALEDLFRDKEAEERLTSARFQQREGELMSSRFQGTNTLGSPVKNKVYASVAEMKRSKKQSSKVRFTDLFFPLKSHGGLKRTFHSTPDLAQECLAAAAATAPSVANGGGAYRQSAYSTAGTTYAFHRSQEDVSSIGGGARGLLPPPTHPPPPVPVGQVIKVCIRDC